MSMELETIQALLRGMTPAQVEQALSTMSPAQLTNLDTLLNSGKLYENLDDPVKWIETNFYIPEINGPLVLAEYQKRCLREALYMDPATGNFQYSVIIWSDLKKSIKSTITAAVALWMGFRSPHGQIQLVANDLKQADSRVGYYLRRAVNLNPALRGCIRVNTSGYKMTLPNECIIEAIPIDPTGEAGGNADMVVFSELWGAASKAQQRMWTETTTSPTKYGRSFRWVESYAGFTGESVLLENLYEETVINGDQLWGDLEVFVNRPGRMFCLWNTRPRLRWQTKEYYAEQASQLDPSEFARVHRNQWVSSTSNFVPGEWLEFCRAGSTGNSFEVVPALEHNEPIIGALDAGTKQDSFGMLGVSVRTIERNKLDGTPDDYKIFIPRFVHVWTPGPNQPIEYSDPPEGPRDPTKPSPQTMIERLSEELHIVEWVYDPYQLHNLATNLNNRGVGYFVEMNQNVGGKRAKADKNLYDIIRDRSLLHDGNSDLLVHLKNANKQAEGDGMRLQKRARGGKIDLAVCLSMACWEALELNLG